jgi:hypothetical protein
MLLSKSRHFRQALVKRSGRSSTLVAAFVVTLTCMLAAAAGVARAEDRPKDPWDGKLHVDVTLSRISSMSTPQPSNPALPL